MAKCKGCGAEIEWVKLTSGKMHPVNKKLIMIVSEIEDEFGNGQGVSEIIRGHESHFATCPKAAEFIKKEKQKYDEENGTSKDTEDVSGNPVDNEV